MSSPEAGTRSGIIPGLMGVRGEKSEMLPILRSLTDGPQRVCWRALSDVRGGEGGFTCT
jgi:hypothetical protein